MTRPILLFVFAASLAQAAVTGVVINRTTGKPQAGATVALNQLAQQAGITLIDQAKSDAQGRFTIATDPKGGPHLLRTAFDGVTYNHMLPPGSPTTGITLDVYNAAKTSGDAKVGKHMILLEPSGGQVTVSETIFVSNPGKTAWNNPDQGTLRFFVPAGAKATVQATAPGGLPIGAPVVKTGKPDIAAVDFPIKPGESKFDVSYSFPYTAGSPYAGKVPTDDENTYLIVPKGIALAGDGLNDLGVHQATQAHIYGLPAKTYNITLTGEAAPVPSDTASGDQPESSGPQIEQIMPRVNGKVIPILGLAFGILAIGFVLLYRNKESGGARQ